MQAFFRKQLEDWDEARQRYEDLQKAETKELVIGDHTLTAFCPLAGQPQTRQKGYIYGIFQ